MISDVYTFDQIGIGTTNPGVFPFQVGAGGSIFHSDGIGNVGIATTVVGQYKLYVVGSTNIVGTCTATTFSGDGSGFKNVSVPQVWLDSCFWCYLQLLITLMMDWWV